MKILRRSARAAICALTLGLFPNETQAELWLDYSGTFSGSSTFNGVAFGMPTPFTFSVRFNEMRDRSQFNDSGIFLVDGTFQITGHGTFRTVVGNVFMFLQTGGQTFDVGLSYEQATYGFYGSFLTASPPFDADAPAPTIFSQYLGVGGYSFPYTLNLEGAQIEVNDNSQDFTLGSAAQIRVITPARITAITRGNGDIVLQGTGEPNIAYSIERSLTNPAAANFSFLATTNTDNAGQWNYRHHFGR